MQLQQKHFTAHQVTTSYFVLGEGEPLLFLPGWGTTTETYTGLLSLLAERHRVISLDLPGFGRGNSPDHIWTFQEYASFVNLFIEELEEKALILSGHSFGAGVALYTAAKNKKISKLILFDAAGLPVEYNTLIFFALYLKELFLELLTPRHFFTSIHAVRIFLLNITSLIYKIRLAFAVFDRRIATDESIFKAVSASTMVFWGDEDAVFTKNIAEELNEKLHGEKVIWIKGSHNWCIFDPQRLKPYLNLI